MRSKEEREARINQLMISCQHFNGIMNASCKAGVMYSDLHQNHAKDLPCIVSIHKSVRPIAECIKYKGMTRVEAEAAYEQREKELAETLMVIRLVHDDAKAKGLVKGKGGSSSTICPVCQGMLEYSVAGLNGYIHGRCRTEGCIRWM